MKKYSDKFVKQLKEGNRKEQKQLFDETHAHMFRICRRYTGRNDEAEDCMMRGYLKAMQQVQKLEYRNEESLYWWVRRIMVNESLMALRKGNQLYLLPAEDLPETGVSAEAILKLDADDIDALVMQLPAGYRAVFSLNVTEGYGHAEIAEMLGISESTSKSQLFKARARLREMLEQNEKRYEQARG